MHDPAGLPFRRAPMAESSRSIAIPLASDLHLAFDVHLLRTHTVWEGQSLNLFGPPFTETKSPFICTYDGDLLWTMPPVNPWVNVPSESAGAGVTVHEFDFRGISSKGNSVTLLYELELRSGGVVRVHESPRPLASGNTRAVVRRLEIGPSDKQLWFLAHAEMGTSGRGLDGTKSAVIRRTGDFLGVAARGLSAVSWTVAENEVAYDIELMAEREGDSIVEKQRVEGHETRLYLQIPEHEHAIVVEIVSVASEDLEEIESVTSIFSRESTEPPDLGYSFEKQRNPNLERAPVFTNDPAFSDRLHGDDFFQIEHFPVPKEIQLMVTGMDWLPTGDLAICTWSGEIYVVENPLGPVRLATYRRFASGLNEAFGLMVIEGQIYVMQKSELTRVTDTDGNGEADLFETINDDWGYTGNYHAFAFGPVLDKNENLYVFLTGQRGRWDVPYVGWALKMDRDGLNLEGFCNGLRAPNGFGTYGPDGDVFIADNQGNWIGACRLNHLQAGRFYGFPSGHPAPKEEYSSPKSPSPPAIWFPRKLSPSTSGLVTIEDDRFGPFNGQMLVGDFQNAVVMRVFLEEINGEWQGAVWPFAKGFYSGVNRLAMGSDGRLYAGGLKNRSWAASAPKEFSLDRVSFKGKIPFEVKEARAVSDGFELVFTMPVDRESAADPENYFVSQYNYEYHQTYGSPEIDHDGKINSATEIDVRRVSVSEDGMRVTLALDGWKTGFVTAVQLLDVESGDGDFIWHETFYYTLNQIPK